MKMKKRTNLIMGLVFALLLFVVVLNPLRAEAAAKVKTLKNGVSTTMGKEGQFVYKLTLNEDSVVKVTWSENNNNHFYFAIHKSQSLDAQIVSKFPDTAKGNISYALKKGTYYVEMYDGYSFSSYTPTAKVKFEWQDASIINKNNYCRAKAISLDAKTAARVAQTPTQDYVRWYKIKLTKSQKLSINVLNGSYSYIRVLSPSYTSYETSYSKGTLTTTEKLSSGTYFICVNDMYNSYKRNVLGEYIVFKWQ